LNVPRAGESFFLILEGTLVVEFRNGDQVRLETGDSISYRARTALRCSNDTRKKCHLYVEMPRA
jgi:uncharacterized cupin superfamily protein